MAAARRRVVHFMTWTSLSESGGQPEDKGDDDDIQRWTVYYEPMFRRSVSMSVLFCTVRFVAAQTAGLPGAGTLVWNDDLSVRMMDGAHRFVERKIAESLRCIAAHERRTKRPLATDLRSLAQVSWASWDAYGRSRQARA